MTDPMAYVRCDLCDGSLEMVTSTARFDESSNTIAFDERKPRPCVCVGSPTPGWSPTGLTMGQLERMAERERVLQGDPGVPQERRLKVLVDLRNMVDRASALIPVEVPR